mmetsp:Transcript_31758/g.71193  ORF Transcript_31758/g.71193 Transcript_31758/m.71193 type:complete len:139 (+) Transcript_31758:29-445(+)
MLPLLGSSHPLHSYPPGTHDMSGVKSIGRDASFDSSMCYIWWPDSNAAECIDGTTGFLSSGNIGDSKSCEASDCQSTSECSTYKMTHVVAFSASRVKAPGVSKVRASQVCFISPRDIRPVESPAVPSLRKLTDMVITS